MNAKFDKLTPGIGAKLNLFFDCCFTVLTLLAALRTHEILQTRVFVLLAVALLAWLCTAVFLRLYSPCTPRSRWDNMVLTVIAAITVTVSTVKDPVRDEIDRLDAAELRANKGKPL